MSTQIEGQIDKCQQKMIALEAVIEADAINSVAIKALEEAYGKLEAQLTCLYAELDDWEI